MDIVLKKTIDNMSYEHMLRLNRFATSEHPYFDGKTGEYFMKIMNNKKSQLTNEEAINISKSIGWNR